VRRLSRREITLLVLLGVGIVYLGVQLLLPESQKAIAGTKVARTKSLQEIPRIDLARLDAPRRPGQAGRRNLFEYGAMRQERQVEPPVVVPTPPPSTLPPAGLPGNSGPAQPSLPPLNVKYVGSVESAKGIKVAILVTDRREVLTGQLGQTVAHRYRIKNIGIESVDIEDVNTGESRRIPLRGD